MSVALASTPAFLVLAVLSSAVYVLAPSIAYAVIVLVLAAISAAPVVQRSFLEYVDPYRLAGVLLFNIVYVAASLRTNSDTRAHFLTLISLGTFLTAFATARLALASNAPQHDKGARALRLFACVALVILLGGQVAEAVGYMDPRVFGARPENTSFFERPGGFMNSNMTAAVALALMYVVFEAGNQRPDRASTAALLLTYLSVLAAQSRAGMLFGAIYLLALFTRRRLSRRQVLLLIGVTVAGLVAFFDAIVLDLYLERLGERFGDDNSASERIRILLLGMEAVGDAPFFGHGHRYIQSVAFVSTHNEIVENLVNYGIMGSIGIWISFFLIYNPKSWSFLLACVAPALLFSHNFFETVSLQAVLGVACALSIQQKYSTAASADS